MFLYLIIVNLLGEEEMKMGMEVVVSEEAEGEL
jgi:hypothetical protein